MAESRAILGSRIYRIAFASYRSCLELSRTAIRTQYWSNVSFRCKGCHHFRKLGNSAPQDRCNSRLRAEYGETRQRRSVFLLRSLRPVCVVRVSRAPAIKCNRKQIYSHNLWLVFVIVYYAASGILFPFHREPFFLNGLTPKRPH